MSSSTQTESRQQGRPPKYETEEERREGRRKYNREYHKKVRRPKIEEDPDYKANMNAQERRRYREKHPNYEPKGFGRYAGDADKFARLHDVGGPRRVRAVTIDDMADIIGIVPKVLSGWIEAEKFPRPALRTDTGQRVFTVQQANELAGILKKRLKNRATFRPTDVAVIQELHARMLQLTT